MQADVTGKLSGFLWWDDIELNNISDFFDSQTLFLCISDNRESGSDVRRLVMKGSSKDHLHFMVLQGLSIIHQQIR